MTKLKRLEKILKGMGSVEAREAEMINSVKIEVSEMVRIIGDKIDEENFKAEVIAPGRPPGRHPMLRSGLHKPERKFLNLRLRK